MPHSHLHHAPQALSRFGRALAAAQVAKETLSVVLLGVPLVQAEPLVLVAALPGLVLYGLHWHLLLGKPTRRLAVLIWGFTLVDELWGVLLFQEVSTPTNRQLQLLYWTYFLGLAIIVLALAELSWRWQQRRRAAARNVHHHAVLSARQP